MHFKVCDNQFYSEKCVGNESVAHRNCTYNKKSKKIVKERPIRTSTPISGYENQHIPSFSDSVTDFFYQSWKSGLNSEGNVKTQVEVERCFCQACSAVQPLCYSTHVVYVNTVIFQPFIPAMGLYAQPVGYRPDGTFGVLPIYWPFNGS